MNPRHLSIRIAVAVTASTACAGPATSYKFPVREYRASPYAVDGASQSGLLWGADTSDVIEDARSRRLGDIVIVRVEENADASGSASTSTNMQSSVDAGMSNFFGILERIAARNPKLDTKSLIKALYRSSFKGDGTTKRGGKLYATIPCQVKQLMPNGDVFIEGTKAIQINEEETHLYLSGLVRPYDIDMSNEVSSSRILDARIDFSGRGVISDKQGPGLLHRGMDQLWPF